MELVDQAMELRTQRSQVVVRVLGRRVSWMTWTQTAPLAVDALLPSTPRWTYDVLSNA